MACTAAQLAQTGAAVVGSMLLGMLIGGIAVGLARASVAYRGSGRAEGD